MKKILLAFLIVCGCLGQYVLQMQNDIKGKVTRLHIVANSNSRYDQDMKLKVRDNILKIIDINDRDIEGQIPEIEKRVNSFLKENNVLYEGTAEYGVTYFPTKYYENIALPEGRYKALNVVLGEGKGKNWWCVMFPPLCFTSGSVGGMNSDALAYLQSNLTEDEFKLISVNKDVNMKFKVVELLNKFTK